MDLKKATSSIQHCFICRPSDSTVSEDAGIEPRTVATSELARSHPLLDWSNISECHNFEKYVKFLSSIYYRFEYIHLKLGKLVFSR